MNIKSHLKLAVFLLNSSQNKHSAFEKCSFILGNILPDITCTFIKYPHIPSVMYSSVMAAIEQYLSGLEEGVCPTYMQTGIVTHYLADFFTSAHNEKFGMNRRAHYVYEQILEQKLKKYISENKPVSYAYHENHLIQTIDRLREKYMNMPSGFGRDVQYIAKACIYYVDVIELKIQKISRLPAEMDDVLIKPV